MAIIGHGARTPLGLDCRASAAAVRAGISAVADHPFMIDRFGLPMKVTRDAELDPGRPCAERIAALAEAAAQEALAGRARATKLALVLNLGEPRPGLPEGTSAEVAERLRAALELDGPVHHAMRGHAGGHRRDRGCGTAARSGPRGGRAGRGRGKLSGWRHAGVAVRAGAAPFREQHLRVLPRRGRGLRPARETRT